MNIIRVMYNDGKYDMVGEIMLDSYLGENKIRKFYRNYEKQWVTVGIDPIRKKRRKEVHRPGIERRARQNEL